MDDPAPTVSDPNMPKELRRWEGTRLKGKGRFILVSGVLAWGFPMFLLTTFVVNRKSWGELTAGEITGRAVIWILGGIAFGWWIWRSSEKKYLNYMEEHYED
jgi:hypothetical protein